MRLQPKEALGYCLSMEVAVREKAGFLDRVESALADEGISFWCLGNVQPNPLLERVYDGIELIREKKIDFVLAVGGGSVIDTAKAAALGGGI